VREPVRRDRARRRGPHPVGRMCRSRPARRAHRSALARAPPGKNNCARPGRRWHPAGRGPPRTAAPR
jgi:hypothetical protein